MHPSSDHPDFTALALGEHLHGAPEPEILQALRSAPTGPAEAEAVRRTAARLAAALHREPLPAPDPTLRAAILAATPESLAQRFAGTSPPTTRTNPRTRPRPWLRPLAACDCHRVLAETPGLGLLCLSAPACGACRATSTGGTA